VETQTDAAPHSESERSSSGSSSESSPNNDDSDSSGGHGSNGGSDAGWRLLGSDHDEEERSYHSADRQDSHHSSEQDDALPQNEPQQVQGDGQPEEGDRQQDDLVENNNDDADPEAYPFEDAGNDAHEEFVFSEAEPASTEESSSGGEQSAAEHNSPGERQAHVENFDFDQEHDQPAHGMLQDEAGENQQDAHSDDGAPPASVHSRDEQEVRQPRWVDMPLSDDELSTISLVGDHSIDSDISDVVRRE
jgi:hypothetical protein